MLLFYMDQLRKSHNKDDYRELLELAVIFLGGTPTSGISFKYPGAMHHARWMSKTIYSLQKFIFRNQFEFKKMEKIMNSIFYLIPISTSVCVVHTHHDTIQCLKLKMNTTIDLRRLKKWGSS